MDAARVLVWSKQVAHARTLARHERRLVRFRFCFQYDLWPLARAIGLVGVVEFGSKLKLYLSVIFKIYITAVAAVICLAAVFIFWRSWHEPAYTLVEKCSQVGAQQFQGCVNSAVSAYAAAHPENTGAMLQSLAQVPEVSSVDPRLFAQAVHEVGMTLSSKHIALRDAFLLCGETFKQGCRHGYVMEYIDTHYTYPTSASDLFEFCDEVKMLGASAYLNCLHGIGHELLVKVNRDLHSAVEACMKRPELTQAYACASGVFMEYSKGPNETGGHSEARVGSRELPCDQFTGEAETICYGSAGSYRQFEADSEPFGATYAYCYSVQEPYRTACAYGVGERLLMSVGFSKGRADELCGHMEGNLRGLCLNSIARVAQSIKK